MKNSKNLSLFGRTGKLQRLFLIALFSVLAIGAYAQSKTVSGTVVDQTGEPIIGANVVVKGTTNGIITDLDGRFTLSNVPDKGTISISFIGYQDQEISVAGKTNLQVTLQEDNAMLDEVVVVGYGVQKKSDVTGAMARVGEKELKAMPVKNALEGMQGKTAGVDITSSQRPGEVGGINIRGVRSIDAEQGPLYVVVTENDLEQSILDNLQHFLLEMGHGFCFEARQKRILIDEDYFFADLVFYHRILKCHIIVELKIDKFRHEYASQLNMYLNYFKAEVMQPDDNPPIGILLCTEKGDTLVKYATAGLDPNIFVQKYMIELPTEEEIKEFISSSNY